MDILHTLSLWYKEEVVEHEEVKSLIPMSNGQFASGGGNPNQCLNIWSPSS